MELCGLFTPLSGCQRSWNGVREGLMATAADTPSKTQGQCFFPSGGWGNSTHNSSTTSCRRQLHYGFGPGVWNLVLVLPSLRQVRRWTVHERTSDDIVGMSFSSLRTHLKSGRIPG
jgi:hypothetical protein